MANLRREIERTRHKKLPKFVLVVSRSGLNKCSVHVVLKVNKTIIMFCRIILMEICAAKSLRTFFPKTKYFQYFLFRTSSKVPPQHLKFVFDFSWVTPETPHGGGGVGGGAWAGLHLTGILKGNINVMFLTDDGHSDTSPFSCLC